MRFVCYLMLLFFSTAQAQAPVVVDADKVTRVVASRNYVRNPDARVNIANVAPGTFTVTRSTTTPMSENGVSEFNLSGTGLTTNAALWTVSGFTQGLKSTQCEARFRYRNANSSTVFEVRQGATGSTANVIARVVADVSATDSRIGSIPFPCGDLSVATWFAVTGTSLSGMELAEVYVGAVQAFGDGANISAWQSYTPTLQGFNTPLSIQSYWRRVGDTAEINVKFGNGAAPSPATQARVGLPSGLTISTFASDQIVGKMLVDRNTANSGKEFVVLAQSGDSFLKFSQSDFSLSTSPFFILNAENMVLNGNTISLFARVPIQGWSATNAAVTPSSQNVWGGVKFSGGPAAIGTTSAGNTILNGAAAGNPIVFGPNVTASGSGCGTTNDVGFCARNLPAGTYRVSYQGILQATSNASATNCYFILSDGTTNFGGAESNGTTSTSENNSNIEGLISYSSFQSQVAFTLRANRVTGGGSCQTIVDSSNPRFAGFILTRIDSQNTQPIFIQSPVKAAGTGVAPISGDVNERLNASNTTTSNAVNGIAFSTPAIALTPGCWDFSVTSALISAGTLTGSGSTTLAITTAANALTGSTFGDTQLVTFANSSTASHSIPPKRICVTTTTNYFGTSIVSLTSGTGTQNVYAQAVRAMDR